MRRIRAQAPGKLVLFGEYAVIEGYESLVASVNRYARCSIDSHEYFELDAGRFGRFDAAQLAHSPPIVRALLTSLSGTPLKVSLDTEDFYISNAQRAEKLGLGSSAAISVALAGALAIHDNERLNPARLFSLAHNVHHGIQGVGSGVDIAAACFGSVFSFVSRQQDQPTSCNPGIHHLQAGSQWATLRYLPSAPSPLLCVYLGHGASTPKLVKQVHNFRAQRPQEYQQIMHDLGTVSMAAIDAWLTWDTQKLTQYITEDGAVLRALDSAANCQIIPPSMRALNETLRKLGAVGKTTGAGGGDMAWVLCHDEHHQRVVAEKLSSQWEVFHLDISSQGIQDVSTDSV